MSGIWLLRFGYLICIYQFLRLLFWAQNLHALTAVDRWQQCLAFVLGLRFDLAIIATLNVPLIVLHVGRFVVKTQSWQQGWDRLVSALFVAVNLPVVYACLVDATLFSFTGRRMSPDFFDIGEDLSRQGFDIAVQYAWVTLLAAIATIVTSWFAFQMRYGREWPRGHRLSVRLGLGVGTALCAFLAIRGGWQRKPLAPAHAYVWQPAGYANLILNSGMTLLRSPPAEKWKRYEDFASMQEVRALLTPSQSDQGQRVPLAAGKNVIVLVVESLASEYVGALNGGKGYTPFLDSLMAKCVTFEASFANGRRSIDAMPAIFASVPAWRDQPFVTSAYSSNTIQALPRILTRHGYQSLFFHGAANGSMHFDVFSAISGFQRYVGLSEYPNRDDYDGQWGVYDEPFLKFAALELSLVREPFVAGIFTLSSHNPFKVPPQYKGKFSKGTLPIHESIGYADHALSAFFAAAKNLPWYKNTIFVITGDHTSLSDQAGYNNFLGRYRVPILFFDPTESLPRVGAKKIAQHVDIAPTILDLLGISLDSPMLFGWSLFDPAYNGRFVQHEYGQWHYYDHQAFIRSDDADVVKYFAPTDWDTQHEISGDLGVPQYHMLRAMRQYFSNGLMDNSWVETSP